MKTAKELTKIRKKARTDGAAFEKRVRSDLESQGWYVSRFSNNIDLEKGEMTPAKAKPFFMGGRMCFLRSTGFPDFICWKISYGYQIIGVESKVNGILTAEERLKVKFLLEKDIFSEVWIAHKSIIKGKIVPVYIKYTNGTVNLL